MDSLSEYHACADVQENWVGVVTPRTGFMVSQTLNMGS